MKMKLMVMATLQLFFFNQKASAGLIIFPKTQIHRGFWQEGIQENTLESFRAAKSANQLMIELDVQLSKDKKVIVFHDSDLKRLFNLEDKVTDLTALELNQKAKIPTLNDVLSDPKIPQLVNIEIKNWGTNDERLEKELKIIISQNHAESRVVISSFDESALAICAKTMPNIRRAYLVGKSEEENNLVFIKRMKEKLEVAQTNLLHINHNAVKDDLPNLLKEAGLSFSVWTLDDEKRALKLLKSGAASIITNRVDMKL